MPYTNYPNGITSQGIPVIPGLPFIPQGAVFWVDPENGVDANGQAGVGATRDAPMKTLAAAYGLLSDEGGDGIILMNDGNTGKSVRLTAALTWAKDNCWMIGDCFQSHVSHRSRITGESSGATFTPLITVSGHGNYFANFQLFHDYTVDPVALIVTGNRNKFENVHIAGMGHADGGDDAAAASLKINGGQENEFVACTIGLDTIARSTTNAEIELVGSATRNVFVECFVSSYADNAGHLWVKIDGSTDIDRYVWFKRTMFYNAVQSAGTTMTQGFNVHATAGGMVILQDCAMVGATDWAAADNGNVYVTNAAPTAGTSGIAVAVTR